MWFGKTEDIKNCKDLSKEDAKTVSDFLPREDLKDLPVGRYDLSKTVFVNVSEVKTEKSKELFEIHKDFIDVHFVISGEEKTGYAKSGTPVIPYDKGKDVAFYSSEECEFNILNGKTALVFLPNELHLPSVATGEPRKIKKAVFKIKETADSAE